MNLFSLVLQNVIDLIAFESNCQIKENLGEKDRRCSQQLLVNTDPGSPWFKSLAKATFFSKGGRHVDLISQELIPVLPMNLYETVFIWESSL